jgi:hypothetical protein
MFAEPPSGLRKLTKEQEAVVGGLERSSVTIAGAGSGKTETLLHMLHHSHLNSKQRRLIVTSFSRAAADAFGTRVAQTWPGVQALENWDLWKKHHLRTLHSFARNEVCRKFGIAEVRRNHMVSAAISVLRGKSHELVVQEWARDLVLLVDEAQDCSEEQLHLIAILFDLQATIHLVGDPRQAIYAFQGADPSGITKKATAWQHTNFLSVNFRSSPQIVAVLNLLIAGPYRRLTNLEQVPAQVADEDNAHGPKPTVYYCENMHEEGLVKSRLYPEIREGIRDIACKSLAILVRRNADVDQVHQALFVAGIDSLARSSRARIGEEQPPLPATIDVDTIVQVESYHVSKGQQFDRVWVVVQGYGSIKDASQAAEDPDTEATLEDLRLLYVAFSRARTHLSIVIIHAYPPVWLADMLQNPLAIKILRADPAPPNWKDPRSANRPLNPERDTYWSVSRLVHEREAADGLLSHSLRGQRYVVQNGSRADDETRQCTEQVGSLCDKRLSLRAAGSATPPGQLSQQGIAAIHHNTVRLAALSHFPKLATEHWRRVQEGVAQLSRIPLRKGIEGANLQSLAEKMGRDDFFEGLVRHIVAALGTEVPNLSECRIYLAAAERTCRTRDNVSHPLCRELRDLVWRPEHSGAYCLGTSDDITLRIVQEHLQDLLQSHSLRRQPDESLASHITRCYSLVFRDRFRVLDAKASIATRKSLLEHARGVTQAQTATPGLQLQVSGMDTMLARLFSASIGREAERNEAARPLPYLGSGHRSLRLDIQDCCLCRGTRDALAHQAENLVAYLCEQFHAQEEVTAAIAGQTLEWFPSSFFPDDDAKPVRAVYGCGDIYIPGAGGTVIDVRAKSELSIEDETQVILCAAVASAARAILWDTRTACIYVYVLKPGEGEELLQAALRRAKSASDDNADAAPKRRREN